MKKLSFLVIAVAVLFTSCTARNLSKSQNNHYLADNIAYSIVEAINKKDSTAIVELFSKKMQNEVESLVPDSADFINHIKGDTISFSCCGAGTHVSTEKNYNEVVKHLGSSFVLETETEKYVITFYYCCSADGISSDDSTGVVRLSIENFYGESSEPKKSYGIEILSPIKLN